MWLLKKPPIDAARDLFVAATINRQPFMVAVPAQSPYRALAELTEGMKRKGDKASYMQSNVTGKVMGELYKLATGIKAVDVPYRTANESLNDFASGALDFGMVDPVFALVQEREGRIRNLAVSTAQRMQAVPHLPTMVELGFRRSTSPVGSPPWCRGDAAPDYRPYQQMVYRGGGDGGGEAVPQPVRRRSLSDHAG
jgi:Uncharacterized protein conserved in bacteria